MYVYGAAGELCNFRPNDLAQPVARRTANSLPSRTTAQRVVHRRDQLVDLDATAAGWIECRARRDRLTAERDVHAEDEIVDRDAAVGVAIADAGCVLL